MSSVGVSQLQSTAALMNLLTRRLPTAQWIVYAAIGIEGCILPDLNGDLSDSIIAYARVIDHAQVGHDRRSRIFYVRGMYHHVPILVTVKLPKGAIVNVRTETGQSESRENGQAA